MMQKPMVPTRGSANQTKHRSKKYFLCISRSGGDAALNVAFKDSVCTVR
jgi:hypothetical protein